MIPLSVIIPTHNRAQLIGDAIASAANLPGAKIEIIVVDDGSTDETFDVVKSLPFSCHYIYQEQQGVGAARNRGLAHASGEYIVFLDSDDLLLPAKTLYQLPHLQSEVKLGLIYSRWKTVRLSDGLTLRTPGSDHTPNVLSTLLYRNLAPPHACLFRTEVVRELGGFDVNLAGTEDWDLLSRLALSRQRFGFSPHLSAVYRKHHQSLSSDQERLLYQAQKAIDKTFADERLPEKYQSSYKIAKVICFLEAIRRCLLDENYRQAQHFVSYLFESVPQANLWIQPTISSAPRMPRELLTLPEGWISAHDLDRQKRVLAQHINSL